MTGGTGTVTISNIQQSASGATGGTGIRMVAAGAGALTVDGAGATSIVRGGPGDALNGATCGLSRTSAGAVSTNVTGSSITGQNGICSATTGAATTNDVTLNGSTATGTAGDGIVTQTVGGTTTIALNGASAASGTGTATSDGVDASSTGAGVVNGTDNGNIGITVAGTSQAVGTGAGVFARTVNGNITVANTSTAANAVSGGAFGANAESNNTTVGAALGVVTVTGSGAYAATDLAAALAGIRAVQASLGSGAGVNGVVVTGSGTTTAASGNAVGTGVGINAQITNAANASNILVDRSGTVTAGGTGIRAAGAGLGNVTVTTAGSITAGTSGRGGGDGAGINAVQSGPNVAGNTGAVTVTTMAGSTIQSGQDAIAVAAQKTAGIATSGLVGVTNAATLQHAAGVTGGSGIVAGTSALSGATVVNTGTIGATGGAFATGISAASANANSTAAVLVTADTAAVSASGTGIAATSNGAAGSGVTVSGSAAVLGGTVAGISATHSGLGGTVTVSGTGTTTSTGVGIDAQITNVANAGAVLVDRSGAVTGGTIGINALNAGTGNVTVTGAGVVTAGLGIVARATAGNVVVTRAAAVTGTTGAGVTATAAGGNVTVNLAGLTAGATDGVVLSTTGAGVASFTTANNVTGTAGRGIAAGGGTANVTVSAGTTVTGGGAALAATSGQVNFTNLGTITAPLAFQTTGGTGTFVNQAVAFGSPASSAGTTTTIDNRVGATWQLANGASAMDGQDTILNAGTINFTNASISGVETFVNSGLLRTGGGNLTLAGAGAFTNSGVISLQNGSLGDSLTVQGNFAAQAGSQLLVDIDLGRDNADGSQLSDQLIVTGAGSGTSTTVGFNNLSGTTRRLQAKPIVVGDFGTNSAAPPTAAGLPADGVIQYSLAQQGADWVVTSELNTPLAGGLASGLASTQSFITTVLARPGTAFIATLPLDPEADTTSSGVWFRGLGGTMRSGFESTSFNPSGSSATIESSPSLHYGGFQTGADIGRFNIADSDWNVIVGLMGGLVYGDSSQSGIDNNFDARYGGTYVNVNKGSFFSELQLRYDQIDYSIAAPLLGNDDFDTSTDRVTVAGNVGYSLQLDESAAFTPTIGLNYAFLSTDDIGTPIGNFVFEDSESILGYVSGTLSRTTLVGDGNQAITPFVTGTIYSNFGDDTKSSFTDSGGNVARLVTDNIGTYGEVSGGVAYRALLDPAKNHGISQMAASVRGDASMGDDVSGAGLTVQFRLQF